MVLFPPILLATFTSPKDRFLALSHNMGPSNFTTNAIHLLPENRIS
jgi:hypothetical protein